MVERGKTEESVGEFGAEILVQMSGFVVDSDSAGHE